MREYKFKGKRVDNGEWVYGKLFFLDNPKYYSILPIGSDVYPEVSTDGETGRYLIEPIEVIPETIGQYSGFLDGNGKMIYEGDELRLFYGECCQGVHEHDKTIILKDIRFDLELVSYADYVEVIGNIHDKES